MATEEYPNVLPPFMTSFSQSLEADLKNLDPDAQVLEETLEEENPVERGHGVYKIWTRIVEKYSKCGLTNSSDKLVALSGLAKRVSTIDDDRYVAGMWQRYLPMQLFWRTLEKKGKTSVNLLRRSI